MVNSRHLIASPKTKDSFFVQPCRDGCSGHLRSQAQCRRWVQFQPIEAVRGTSVMAPNIGSHSGRVELTRATFRHHAAFPYFT
jgi:hypothetical protein